MLEFKEKFIMYLEENSIFYTDKEVKIIHNCINPNHLEENPSAFTSLTLGEEFSHCASCGFYLDTEQLYNLIDLGFDENLLFINKITKLLNKGSEKYKEVSQTPIYLPIKEDDFTKPYRGISPETFSKVSAFYTFPDNFYGKRIIIPIRDIDNNLVSFEAVSTNKSIVPKILRPRGVDTTGLFGFENMIESDTVFIVEGIFNALSFKEIEYDSLFNFGVGSIKQKVRKLIQAGVKRVVLVGDNDEAGQKFNNECFQILKKYKFRVITFYYPRDFPNKGDANDLLKEMGKDKFKKFVDKILDKL